VPYKDPQSPAALASRRRVRKRQWQRVKNTPCLLEKKRLADRDYAAEHAPEAAARHAAWGPQNRDKINNNSRRYAENHPERRDHSARSYHLRKNYGITVEQYDAMAEAQDGRCALCGVKPEGRLVVDHDHETNEVRALLCFSCNVAIGHLKDDPELCTKAATYLRAHEVSHGK
jgi:Recombination endonuclease VII